MKNLFSLLLLNLVCAAAAVAWFKAHERPPYQHQLSVKQVREEVFIRDEPGFAFTLPDLPEAELDQDIILDATIDSLTSDKRAYFYMACKSPTRNTTLYVFGMRDRLHEHVIYRVNHDTRKILYKCDWSHL